MCVLSDIWVNSFPCVNQVVHLYMNYISMYWWNDFLIYNTLYSSVYDRVYRWNDFLVMLYITCHIHLCTGEMISSCIMSYFHRCNELWCRLTCTWCADCFCDRDSSLCCWVTCVCVCNSCPSSSYSWYSISRHPGLSLHAPPGRLQHPHCKQGTVSRHTLIYYMCNHTG